MSRLKETQALVGLVVERSPISGDSIVLPSQPNRRAVLKPKHSFLEYVAKNAASVERVAPVKNVTEVINENEPVPYNSSTLMTETNADLFNPKKLNEQLNSIRPTSAAALRQLITEAQRSNEVLLMPCVYDGLTARMVERAGFNLTFMTGCAIFQMSKLIQISPDRIWRNSD